MVHPRKQAQEAAITDCTLFRNGCWSYTTGLANHTSRAREALLAKLIDKALREVQAGGMTDQNNQQRIRFGENCVDVTDEHIGTVIAIIPAPKPQPLPPKDDDR